jgi:SPP1 family predicted phage head-tail adaptor
MVMARDHVVTLISVSYSKDELEQMVPTESKREVFCQQHSISQSEFFEAGRSGLQPQHKLTVFEGDYQGETIAELDGVRYSVYRTYLGKGDCIELYLERKAGV